MLKSPTVPKQLIFAALLTINCSGCGYVTMEPMDLPQPKVLKAIPLNKGDEEARLVEVEKSLQSKVKYLDPELYKKGISSERLAQLLAKVLPQFDQSIKVKSVQGETITFGSNQLNVGNLAVSLKDLPDEKTKRRAILLYLSSSTSAETIDTTNLNSLVPIVRSSEQAAAYKANGMDQGTLIAPGLTKYMLSILRNH